MPPSSCGRPAACGLPAAPRPFSGPQPRLAPPTPRRPPPQGYEPVTFKRPFLKLAGSMVKSALPSFLRW